MSPRRLWRGDTLVCATLEGLQSLPLGDAATVTVRTENSIYAVYASDLQGGLRLVTAYDLTGLYRDRNAALMRFCCWRPPCWLRRPPSRRCWPAA